MTKTLFLSCLALKLLHVQPHCYYFISLLLYNHHIRTPLYSLYKKFKHLTKQQSTFLITQYTF